MKYMLDINICVFAIKKKPHSVLEYLEDNQFEGLAVSAISLAELEYGIAGSAFPEKNTLNLMRFLVIARCLPFTHRAAAEYGRIRADLRRRGKLIGPLDMLIAAHAKSEGLILVTNNTREFERIEGLALEDWVN